MSPETRTEQKEQQIPSLYIFASRSSSTFRHKPTRWMIYEKADGWLKDSPQKGMCESQSAIYPSIQDTLMRIMARSEMTLTGQ
jgi:hypothetical protein